MSNVQDVKVKGVPIEIEGKEYHLKYDFNAFADLEEKYGTLTDALNALGGEIQKDSEGKIIMVIDPDTGKEEPARKVSIKALRSIFWAGLLFENPNITEREAGALLDLNTIKRIGPQLAEALKASMPEVEDKVGREAAAAKAEETIKEAINVDSSVKNTEGQSTMNQ